MCSKVLNGHIILTDTSITTILAPEMTYTPQNFNQNYYNYEKIIYVYDVTLRSGNSDFVLHQGR